MSHLHHTRSPTTRHSPTRSLAGNTRTPDSPLASNTSLAAKDDITGHSSLAVVGLQRRSSGIATSSQYSSCLFVFTAGLNVEVFIRHAVNAKSLSTIFRVSGCGDANLTPACHRCQGPRPRAALPAPRPPGLARPLHPTVFVFFL